jgi:hypothetical protein
MRDKGLQNQRVPIFSGSLDIEIKKGQRDASCAVMGVVSVCELSSETVVLLTHRGRISVRGSSLVLIIYDSGIAEVEGRIEGVDLGYGRS